MNKNVCKYIVDERSGIAGILDTEHEDFERRGNGLSCDDTFLIAHIDGIRPTGLHDKWYLDKEKLQRFYQNCRVLNRLGN